MNQDESYELIVPLGGTANCTSRTTVGALRCLKPQITWLESCVRPIFCIGVKYIDRRIPLRPFQVPRDVSSAASVWQQERCHQHNRPLRLCCHGNAAAHQRQAKVDASRLAGGHREGFLLRRLPEKNYRITSLEQAFGTTCSTHCIGCNTPKS